MRCEMYAGSQQQTAGCCAQPHREHCSSKSTRLGTLSHCSALSLSPSPSLSQLIESQPSSHSWQAAHAGCLGRAPLEMLTEASAAAEGW